MNASSAVVGPAHNSVNNLFQVEQFPGGIPELRMQRHGCLIWRFPPVIGNRTCGRKRGLRPPASDQQEARANYCALPRFDSSANQYCRLYLHEPPIGSCPENPGHDPLTHRQFAEAASTRNYTQKVRGAL